MELPCKQGPDKLQFAVENKESNFRDVCIYIQMITKACLNNNNGYNTHNPCRQLPFLIQGSCIIIV